MRIESVTRLHINICSGDGSWLVSFHFLNLDGGIFIDRDDTL